MNTEHTPSVRHDRRTGQYVPQVDGVDLPITTFDEERAWDLARGSAIAMEQMEQKRS